MTGPINTANHHRLVIVGDDELLTVRVQSLNGHNRAVAKLDADQALLLKSAIDDWLVSE